MSPNSAKKASVTGLSSSVERHLRAYFAAHDAALPASGLYERVLQEVERPLLDLTLSACAGNQLRAAELLGLNRNTLRKKLRDLGITTDRQVRRRAEESQSLAAKASAPTSLRGAVSLQPGAEG